MSLGVNLQYYFCKLKCDPSFGLVGYISEKFNSNPFIFDLYRAEGDGPFWYLTSIYENLLECKYLKVEGLHCTFS